MFCRIVLLNTKSLAQQATNTFLLDLLIELQKSLTKEVLRRIDHFIQCIIIIYIMSIFLK